MLSTIERRAQVLYSLIHAAVLALLQSLGDGKPLRMTTLSGQ